MIRKPENVIIGTANFAQFYNGVKVPQDEQHRIWDAAKTLGVQWVDMAQAYGAVSVPVQMKVICKILDADTSRGNVTLWHGPPMALAPSVDGFSVYTPEQVDCVVSCVIQLPYSILNRTWEPFLYGLKQRQNEIHARSLFARGDALKMFTVKQCVDFVVANPWVDKIVVGIENAKQLKDIVEAVCHDGN